MGCQTTWEEGGDGEPDCLGGRGRRGARLLGGGGGDGEPDCLGGGGRKLPLFPPTLLVD